MIGLFYTALLKLKSPTKTLPRIIILIEGPLPGQGGSVTPDRDFVNKTNE